MKLKRLLILLLSSAILCTGCSIGRDSGNDKKATEESSEINGQTATTKIKATKNEEKLLKALDSVVKNKTDKSSDKKGFYFVETPDGDYYPLSTEFKDNDKDTYDTRINPARQIYYTIKSETADIPTLYEDCKLIYYSRDNLLDYITWERYYDLGYTIPVYDIQSMKSGRQYLSFEDDDTILEESNLYDITKLKSEEVLLQSIGGKTIDDKLVSQGLIKATSKGVTYPLEVYDGSYFYNYDATADMHSFRAYELFASIEYTPLKSYFYEVEIPEYFKTGYYLVDGVGFVRLVRGTEWNENDTDFNEQILYPKVELKTYEGDNAEITPEMTICAEAADVESENYISPEMYSSYEPLNKFETNVKGTLGYKDPNAQGDMSLPDQDTDEDVSLEEEKVSTFNLWFPEGKTCIVTVESPSQETTGNLEIIVGNKSHKLTADKLNGTYTANFKGSDEVGTLTIKGLYNSYNIKLVNCTQATDEQIKSSKGNTETTVPASPDTEETVPTESSGTAEDVSALNTGAETDSEVQEDAPDAQEDSITETE